MGAGRPLAHAVLIAGIFAAALVGCGGDRAPEPVAPSPRGEPAAVPPAGDNHAPAARGPAAPQADAGETPDERGPAGEQLARTRGCTQCHSSDGSAKVGPSWQGLFGQERASADGTMEVVDDSFIRSSILEPQASVRQGFPAVMPSYRGMIDDGEIAALTSYIESLR